MGAFQDMIETRERAYNRAAATGGCATGLRCGSRSCSSATSRWQNELRTIEDAGVTWPRSVPRPSASSGPACQRVETALAAAPDTPEYADLARATGR